MKQIGKLAKKVTPWGAAAGVIEWIASGFEDFPYWDIVNGIKTLITGVQDPHTAIKDLAATMSKYFAAAQQIFEAVKRIPDINSSQDIIQITKNTYQGSKGIEKQKEEYKDKRAEVETAAKKVEGQSPWKREVETESAQ